MKPITLLTAEELKRIKLISFDCDGVTVKKGTEIEETETTLTVKTATLSESMLEKLTKLKKYFHVNFSSGRSLLYLERMFGKILWDRASLQGEIGIFTLINGRVIQHEFFSPKDLILMREIRTAIRELAKSEPKIRGFEPKQFLVTVHCREEIPQIEEILKKLDRDERFYSWWNGEAYDIGLKGLNKGSGLKHLCDYLKIDIKDTMAVGNGPNDEDMTKAAGIGVTTEPQWLKADYHTLGEQLLGGEELVDRLLCLKQQ
ncbi:MAG: HAD-IIB family hydrolase [Candidatus Shapirobacteria bacterium]